MRSDPGALQPWASPLGDLLASCQGRGAVVAVRPQALANDEPPHHFYAGVARPPALSFLEALLLALGGDLSAGERRYHEIVVINAGPQFDEEGRDKPPEESIRLPSGAGTATYGDHWSVWWYRQPAANRIVREPAAEAGLPSPARGRRRTWVDPTPSPRQNLDRAFPRSIDLTESETEFPKRHKQLRQIVEELDQGEHRKLLLVEVAVLDYANPGNVDAQLFGRLSDEALSWMRWLPDWIDDRERAQSRLDLVLYSRNRRRVDAFIGAGLPRRPPNLQSKWPVSAYRGRNLVLIDYPCGPFPWGEDFFAPKKAVTFVRHDGTASDTPEGRERFPRRTLRALLRGESPQPGKSVRLRFSDTPPIAPRRPASPRHCIDREYWSTVDIPAIRRHLYREFFGAERCRPITELLATLDFMQARAREVEDPDEYHDQVEDRWKKVSRLMLWGVGGMGKSYLGKLLARTLFGHDALLFKSQESGGGHGDDPNAGIKARLFGPPAGYRESHVLTDIGQHIVNTQGFTVLVFEEVQQISPDFGGGIEALYGILEDRTYIPQNSALTQGRSISLWNTVIVLTGNLSSFPPPGVQSEKVGAIVRRVTDHQFKHLDEEEKAAFLHHHFLKEAENALGGIAVCSCGNLSAELRQVRVQENSLDMMRRSPEVLAISDRLRRGLEIGGVTAANCPLMVDITPYLERALHG